MENIINAWFGSPMGTAAKHMLSDRPVELRLDHKIGRSENVKVIAHIDIVNYNGMVWNEMWIQEHMVIQRYKDKRAIHTAEDISDTEDKIAGKKQNGL